MFGDADVDSANPEILTVEEDEDADEEDDVETCNCSQHILFHVKSELDSNYICKISFSLKNVFNFL